MTIESRLAEIRARADAATEGPWRASVVATYVDADGQRSGKGGVYPGGDQGSPPLFLTMGWLANDAEFIAHARTDVPALLSAVEAVMKRHRPVEVEPSETICAECSTLRGQGETARYFPFTEYPCPTVTRIQEALNGIA